MKKEIKNIVIVPTRYVHSKEPSPVVYLLHGAGEDYTAWTRRVPKVKELAELYNIIIVCPDGGVTSWYLDSPVDSTYRYESYMTQELVPSVDKMYRTVKNRKGRAITGLSMGGHGAFYLAIRHPDIWGAAGSMSGGMDIRPFPLNWDLPKRLGEFESHKDNWEKNTITNMMHLVPGSNLQFIFDCGVDDFFYDGNATLHRKMVEMKISHEYIERPGGHTWEYWNNAIEYQFLFLGKYFSKER